MVMVARLYDRTEHQSSFGMGNDGKRVLNKGKRDSLRANSSNHNLLIVSGIPSSAAGELTKS